MLFRRAVDLHVLTIRVCVNNVKRAVGFHRVGDVFGLLVIVGGANGTYRHLNVRQVAPVNCIVARRNANNVLRSLMYLSRVLMSNNQRKVTFRPTVADHAHFFVVFKDWWETCRLRPRGFVFQLRVRYLLVAINHPAKIAHRFMALNGISRGFYIYTIFRSGEIRCPCNFQVAIRHFRHLDFNGRRWEVLAVKFCRHGCYLVVVVVRYLAGPVVRLNGRQGKRRA